jgi:hypothetical protein
MISQIEFRFLRSAQGQMNVSGRNASSISLRCLREDYGKSHKIPSSFI